MAAVVATTDVKAERDARVTSDDGVVHLDAAIDELVGIISAGSIALPNLGIEEGRVLWGVELNVFAAEPDQFVDLGSENVDHVGEIRILSRIGTARDGRI